MKKIILILLSIITFTNCESEEQIPDTIIGKWKLEKSLYVSDIAENDALDVSYPTTEELLEFKENGIVEASRANCSGTFQDFENRFILDFPCMDGGVFWDSKEFSYSFKNNRLYIKPIDKPVPFLVGRVWKKL